ncbi:MAG: chromosomal replication initiator protein DnaA [Armatimonadota bacterium]|nr:MAG: chromosomal replication initiator protein DnaA [Armatimonadota bacterium]
MDDQLHLGEDENMLALRRAWDRAMHTLANRVNKPSFESWFKSMKPVSFDGERVTLGAPSPFACEWVSKRYGNLVREVLSQHLGKTVEVSIVYLPPEKRPVLGEPPAEEPPSAPREATVITPEPEAAPFEKPVLNPKYTFENFVVGNSNRLAQAGAMSVARAPGQSYNPLFIYGGAGLGKTHLMHAIGHYVLQAHPRLRVAYLSGETFAQQYIAALREQRIDAFRQKYRNVDVWLVDDIQFIAGKEHTKEEFFHTFNTLYQMGRQVVFASDRPPRELHAMDDRLRSRFEAGLIADIAPPEFETRVAILQKRAQIEGIQIPDQVIYHIAYAVEGNVRTLEGVLISIAARASVHGKPITLQLANEVLARHYVDEKQVHAVPSEQAVLQAVCQRFGLTTQDILGDQRSREVLMARQIAMYLLREKAQLPLQQIGQMFGKNHSTVLHAYNRVKTSLNKDKELTSIIYDLNTVLGN